MPSLTRPTTDTGVMNITCTLPPSSAVATSDEPLYGTCSSVMPAFCANTSGARCRRLPTPGEPYSTRPDFAVAINSPMLLIGDFASTSTSRPSRMPEVATGRRSVKRVVAEVLVDMRRRRDRRRGEEQRQPVRRRRRDRARRDGAVGAESVLDEERLLQVSGELLRDGARLQVRARARGEADETRTGCSGYCCAFAELAARASARPTNRSLRSIGAVLRPGQRSTLSSARPVLV